MANTSALQSARRLHEAGRLQDAEAAYRRALEADPNDVEALHLLGALLCQTGRFDAAVATMQRAVRCRPSDPVLRNNLANALKDAGRLQEAEESYRQAIAQRADFAEAHSSLGSLLHALGRFAEAQQCLRTALSINPRHAYAHNYLGMVLSDLGQREAGIAAFRCALSIEPRLAQAHYNLGVALLDASKPQEAEQALRRALAFAPGVAAIHIDLGNALLTLGRLAEAEQSYRQGLVIQPESALAYLGLASVLRQAGELADAEGACRRALQINPNLAQAHSNLGLVLFQIGKTGEAQQCYERALALEPSAHGFHAGFGHVLMGLGRLADAERSFRKAIELSPGFASAQSSLLFLLNHLPGKTAEQIYEEHREFGRRFTRSGAEVVFRNSHDAHRRLRIGYVSGDLKQHSVASFIEPVLSKHDADRFEITCYYNNAQSDATTQRLKSYAHRWRDIFSLTDEGLAQLIRDDEIDILIDLSGHTANNRLVVFAHKPAPVQATWLGYLNTTGLDAMDWRITDVYASPEGPLDKLHSERLFRLPRSQWCYQPPAQYPDVSSPPSLANGFCTFGAFSTPAKINDEVIKLWSGVLRAVPRSRLVVATSSLKGIPDELRQRFRQAGIENNQVEILPARGFDDYLRLHESVDVVLDTFPYTGGTTTCHALWMSTPVISLVGDTATSRGGASLLQNVGVPELIAETREQYVAIAVQLAQEPDVLTSLRSSLRERMHSSTLTDAVAFTRHLESAYRTMWQRWCAIH